ncbi:branched-chain amino acid ABC transporter permease [Luteipulveratus sp. YIM 133132]|uniref:Branched-chain amino acid ABC transporter permease n=1 Tax=Luteipulveratus flavus TaxID=3031728 RepID=A0ABT6C6A7_9MICO|nr:MULTISPECIES: branched-chain amino acid ABC transporter permease [unclassified Luteipulveratus]MDE9366001.1 branched-chain amino acid ABC transporter permease [Luteipulveratus sp. YIM 133132]MDF8264103.1 branched-chain amino acid ABC transporter permease [Luteipulveratus sp. YIM 133296]
MTSPIEDAAATQSHLDEQSERPKRGPFDGLARRWDHLERWQQWGVLALVAALVYLLPVLNPPLITSEPSNDFPITCANMAIYALAALGLNAVVGQAGLLDLGYIGFFAVGAYVTALWTSTDSTFVKIPYLWTLPLAMIVTVFFGIILGLPTLRLRGDYLAIVTLGFGEIIRLLATIIPALRGQVGFQNVGAPPGTKSDGNPVFANSSGTPWYWLTVTIIILLMVLLGNIERSRAGRAWIAIREDEDAAEIMGVPTFKFKLWAFAIGAALGGLSGALFGGLNGFVNNQKFDVQTSMLFLAAVVLGGAGNKFGAVIGGALVAYLPLRFTGLAEYKFLIFGVILVVLMIFRPQGLFGARNHLLTYASRARRWLGEKTSGSGATAVPATEESSS